MSHSNNFFLLVAAHNGRLSLSNGCMVTTFNWSHFVSPYISARQDTD